MHRHEKHLQALVIVAALVAALAGCQKQESAAGGKGPAEKAGEQIDRAAAKAGEELNKLGEKAGQELQQAGEKLEGASREAQNSREQQNNQKQ